MAQGPRPTKALLLSTDQILTNQMSYFQTRNGPLRFFKLAGRRGHCSWCAVRCGAVMLAHKTYSISFKRAAVFSRATFDGVMNEKL